MAASIGFLGLGMMGAAMAQRLIDHGYAVNVWNRTKNKADRLIAAGAKGADTIASVAEQNSIVFSMLSTSDVLGEVAGSVRASMKPGGIHVDFSTVSPEMAADCERKAKAEGLSFLHAPVLGSVPQAQDGSLLLFTGGDNRSRERVRPYLDVIGKKVYPFPQASMASHIKLVCNFFISSMITTLGQGLRYTEKAGIEPTNLLEILAASALNAPMYQSKGKSILAQNFAPRFMLEHMLKDARLFAESSARLDLQSKLPDLLEETFEMAVSSGLGKEDYSAVSKVL